MEGKLSCILLIDDDDITNFIHQKTLQKSEIAEHIEVCLNGKEALDFLTNKELYLKTGGNYPPPSLIFLDINMPIMDGWEFLQDYQRVEMPDNKQPKIIMLTTSANPDDEAKAQKYKVVLEYMSKPLTQEMISGIMQKYFSPKE